MNVTIARTSSGAPKFLNCALSSVEPFQDMNEDLYGDAAGHQPQEVNYGT